jgi:hypothetical protein
MCCVQFFQRATAEQLGALPRAPESDAGLAQAIHIQRVPALRRRNHLDTPHMFVQQRGYFLAGKIIHPDIHLLLRSYTLAYF